jgi:hypothetical protein
MKKNMGLADRLIRTLMAVAVVILYLLKVVTGPVAVVLLVIAAIFILTSFAGNCPLYSIFGINTCSKKLNT